MKKKIFLILSIVCTVLLIYLILSAYLIFKTDKIYTDAVNMTQYNTDDFIDYKNYMILQPYSTMVYAYDGTTHIMLINDTDEVTYDEKYRLYIPYYSFENGCFMIDFSCGYSYSVDGEHADSYLGEKYICFEYNHGWRITRIYHGL